MESGEHPGASLGQHLHSLVMYKSKLNNKEWQLFLLYKSQTKWPFPMAALPALLSITHDVCGQKPDILIYKVTLASQSSLEFRNRNKFRLQLCQAPRTCSEEKVEVFAVAGLSRKREEKHQDQVIHASRTAEGCRGSTMKAAPHSHYLRFVSESGVLGVTSVPGLVSVVVAFSDLCLAAK